MLLLSLYVLAVVAMFVVTVRSRPDGRAVVLRARLRPRRAAHAAAGFLRRRSRAGTTGAAGTTSTAGTAGAESPGQVERAARPESPASLEGMLTILLLGGEITRSQYRRAVEEIAARDEVGHPLAIPPDPGPAAG